MDLKHTFRNDTRFLLISSSLLLITIGSSCQKPQSLDDVQVSNESPITQSLVVSKYDVNHHPSNKVVCDPFQGIPPENAEKGVLATLYYQSLNPAAPLKNYKSALDYAKYGSRSSQEIFLADINVPTRIFSEGFATQTNSFIKTDSGEKLIEYFGLKLEADLILTDSDEEGDYELSILADDGAVVKAKIDGIWQTIINNDGDHPTRMGCASSLLKMKRNKSVSIEVSYYQGPRYHIANVLMWRKVADGSLPGLDQSCGQLGNSLYFNPDQGSKILPAYTHLLSRQWIPIPAKNFNIPGQTVFNPCVQGTNPVISNFISSEVLFGEINVSWTTDIPSTSQILVTNVKTGEQTLSTSDNLLRTSHQMKVSGLPGGSSFKVQAISISEDLGKTTSDAIIVDTL